MTGSNVSDGSTPGSDGASVPAPMVLTLPDTPDIQVAAVTLRGQRDLSLRAHPPGTVLSAGPDGSMLSGAPACDASCLRRDISVPPPCC